MCTTCVELYVMKIAQIFKKARASCRCAVFLADARLGVAMAVDVVFRPIVALFFSSLIPLNIPYPYYSMPLQCPLFPPYKLVDCHFVLVMVFVRNHAVVARPPILPCVLASKGT